MEREKQPRVIVRIRLPGGAPALAESQTLDALPIRYDNGLPYQGEPLTEPTPLQQLAQATLVTITTLPPSASPQIKHIPSFNPNKGTASYRPVEPPLPLRPPLKATASYRPPVRPPILNADRNMHFSGDTTLDQVVVETEEHSKPRKSRCTIS